MNLGPELGISNPFIHFRVVCANNAVRFLPRIVEKLPTNNNLGAGIGPVAQLGRFPGTEFICSVTSVKYCE